MKQQRVPEKSKREGNKEGEKKEREKNPNQQQQQKKTEEDDSVLRLWFESMLEPPWRLLTLPVQNGCSKWMG